MSNCRTKMIASTAMVAITFFTSSLSARASNIAPFACGPSTADIVEEPETPHIWIGDSEKAIKLVNKAGADCGVVIFDFAQNNILRDSDDIRSHRAPTDPNSLKIVVKVKDLDELEKDPTDESLEAIKNVVVRMCFKPQLGLPDLISVDVPLKDFRPDEFNGFIEFKARRNLLFGNRPGVPDLRKLSVILTKPGSITVGKIKWGVDDHTSLDPDTIVLSNAGCNAAQPCRVPIKTLIKSRKEQERPTRPTR